jgi:hypothetical protein
MARCCADAGFTIRGRIIWDKNTTGNRTSWGSFRLPSSPALRDTTECIIVAHKGADSPVIPNEIKQHDEKGTYAPWLADSDYFMELAQDHWVVAPESAQRVKHPAPFPTELVTRLVHFYAYPGAHLLDPFAGSGTTLAFFGPPSMKPTRHVPSSEIGLVVEQSFQGQLYRILRMFVDVPPGMQSLARPGASPIAVPEIVDRLRAGSLVLQRSHAAELQPVE